MIENDDQPMPTKVAQAMEQLGQAMDEAGVTGFLQLHDPESSTLQGVSFPAMDSVEEHHPITQLTVWLVHAAALGADDEELESLLQAVRIAVSDAEADNHTVQ